MTFGAGFGFPRARFPMGAAPTLNMDFAGTAALPPYVTFSRGTNATYVDSAGNIAYAPSNLLTYSEQFDNAVWAKSNTVITANATIAPDGTITADTITDTVDAVSTAHQVSRNVTVTAGEIYTLSIYARSGTGSGVSIGTPLGVFPVEQRVFYNTNTGVPTTQLGTPGNVVMAPIGNGWYRCSLSLNVPTSGTMQIIYRLYNFAGAGFYVGDGTQTVFIWGAQLNLGDLQPYNSTTVKNLLGYTQDFDNAAWTKSNSFIQTNLLTYSEQFDNAAWGKSSTFIQTNQIRNNTAQGAVAGSPGTLPTNWGVTNLGLTQTIVGTGTENGITYIDIRLNGTTTGQFGNVRFEPNNSVTASSGQTWTVSSYLKLIAGSLANLSEVGMVLYSFTSAPAFISSSNTGAAVNADLTRFDHVGTLPATTAFVQPAFYFNTTAASGQAIDITLRIGLPQLVQGAVPGDVVRTYGTAMPVMYPSPIGTLTADKLVETIANNEHYLRQIPVTQSGAQVTFSYYIKAGERSSVRLRVLDSSAPSNGFYGSIDSVTGATTGASSGTGTFIKAISTFVSDGWYRLSIIGTASPTATTVIADLFILSGNEFSNALYTGDGTSGIYIWGAQLVQGATPGDYQATTTAALAVQYRAPDGSLTADKLVEDTATSTHFCVQNATIVSGTPYTFTCYIKAAERLFASIQLGGGGFGNQGVSINLTTGASTVYNGATSSSVTSVGNGWWRISVTATASGTSGAPLVLTNNILNGQNYTGDGTSGVYIWGAQLSDSASLDPYSYNFTTTPTAAAYYGPRFDYDPVTLACKGLLIEEQRTNSIRNNTMQGAVAGNPGTLPTNWQQNTGAVAVNVVGVGIEQGVSYIDLRFVGTTSQGINNLRFEPNTQITAASAQAWASSFFARQVGGSTANIQGVENRIYFRDAAGVSLEDIGSTVTTLNAVSFSEARSIFLATGTNVSIARVSNGINIATLSGVAIDITLRIGLPQLEQGAFATSVIPTTTAAVTRAADVAVIQGANFSNWYNQSEGTIIAKYDHSYTASATSFPVAVNISDGTTTKQISLYAYTLAPTGETFAGSSPVGWALNAGPLLANNTIGTLGGAYAANDFAASLNSATPVTSTLGTVPPVTNMRIGARNDSAYYLNGHIARIAYYSTRQPNATLQAITT